MMTRILSCPYGLSQCSRNELGLHITESFPLQEPRGSCKNSISVLTTTQRYASGKAVNSLQASCFSEKLNWGKLTFCQDSVMRGKISASLRFETFAGASRAQGGLLMPVLVFATQSASASLTCVGKKWEYQEYQPFSGSSTSHLSVTWQLYL